eukprot:TRINITY_DN50049_c0_g1_i1.p1 TRINITY_DN50049_c0_g1~~TRINITY_DN50049_c0_g1_i1.p1  ORF type:complete len:378 (-),score=28.47 TRINITY_DN50049_c0_g1_i1:44-1177(-)
MSASQRINRFRANILRSSEALGSQTAKSITLRRVFQDVRHLVSSSQTKLALMVLDSLLDNKVVDNPLLAEEEWTVMCQPMWMTSCPSDGSMSRCSSLRSGSDYNKPPVGAMVPLIEETSEEQFAERAPPCRDRAVGTLGTSIKKVLPRRSSFLLKARKLFARPQEADLTDVSCRIPTPDEGHMKPVPSINSLGDAFDKKFSLASKMSTCSDDKEPRLAYTPQLSIASSNASSAVTISGLRPAMPASSSSRTPREAVSPVSGGPLRVAQPVAPANKPSQETTGFAQGRGHFLLRNRASGGSKTSHEPPAHRAASSVSKPTQDGPHYSLLPQFSFASAAASSPTNPGDFASLLAMKDQIPSHEGKGPSPVDYGSNPTSY